MNSKNFTYLEKAVSWHWDFLLLVDRYSRKEVLTARSWLQTASWDPAADSESHNQRGFPKHAHFPPHENLSHTGFSICGIFEGLQFKRKTVRRNVAINDIKFIHLRNVTKKGNKWNRNTWYPPNLWALFKKNASFYENI